MSRRMATRNARAAWQAIGTTPIYHVRSTYRIFSWEIGPMPAPRTPATRPASASMTVLRRRKTRLAKICEAFPETSAANTWDSEHLSLEVAGKRFGYYLYRHFGDDGRSGAVLKAHPGVQEMLVEADPDRFWVPAFVGRHGWIGIRLDLEEPDWDELGDFVRDAWLMTAPRKVRLAFESAK